MIIELKYQLCEESSERIDHLFFECAISWEVLSECQDKCSIFRGTYC